MSTISNSLGVKRRTEILMGSHTLTCCTPHVKLRLYMMCLIALSLTTDLGHEHQQLGCGDLILAVDSSLTLLLISVGAPVTARKSGKKTSSRQTAQASGTLVPIYVYKPTIGDLLSLDPHYHLHGTIAGIVQFGQGLNSMDRLLLF